MSTPSTNVAISAPTRLLTFFAAHVPNAADAPVALMSATKMPKITRNAKMPALSAMEGISPVARASSSVPPAGMNVPLMMASTVPMGSNPVSKSAPTTMPTNSEL